MQICCFGMILTLAKFQSIPFHFETTVIFAKFWRDWDIWIPSNYALSFKPYFELQWKFKSQVVEIGIENDLIVVIQVTHNSAQKCLHFYDSRITTDAKLSVYLKSKCISFHFSPCLFFNQITAIFIEWIEWYHFEFFIEEIFFHACHKLAFHIHLLKYFFIHNNFVLVIEVFSSH